MKFEFKIPPWEHQLRELEYTKDLEAWGLLWQMRTGKTKVVIDTAMHLFIENRIDAVLVVTRSGVHSNWIRKEVPKHCSIPYDAEWWDAERAQKKSYVARLHDLSLCESLIFFSVNNESFIRPLAQSYLRKLLRLRVLLVVDEVHDFRSHTSLRTKLIHKLARHCAYRRILTGTNNGNCPLSNWGQFEILEQGALGFAKYSDFEKRYAVIEWERNNQTGKMYKVISGYRHLKEMQASIDRLSSTIRRADCPDLPPLVVSSVDVKLSLVQKKFYRQLKREFEVALETGQILTAEEASVRRMKLQQVLSNFVVDEHGRRHTVDAKNNPRMDRLLEQLLDVDAKAIVWCRFQQDLDNVAARLSLEGIRFVEYHGRVSKPDRFEAERRFREDPLCTVFLGQPQSAGLGLDLSSANTIIWYSHTDDIVTRDQANERATQKGSSAVAVIDLVVPDSVDEEIMENLKAKREIDDFMNRSRTDWRQRMLESLKRDLI